MTVIPSITQSRPSSPPASDRMMSSDFETFLKMLTAQIQHQDPLEPMPSSDFAVQLATFSAVEQQVRTNQLLEEMTGGGAGGLTEVAGWVGMEARAPGPALFRGDPLPLWVAPAAGADAAQMVVRDGLGREVERRDIGPQPATHLWDGRTPDGARRLDGPYAFEVVSFMSGAPFASSLAEAYGRVVEVRNGDAGPIAVLEGGLDVPVAAISALRVPGAER